MGTALFVIYIDNTDTLHRPNSTSSRMVMRNETEGDRQPVGFIGILSVCIKNINEYDRFAGSRV